MPIYILYVGKIWRGKILADGVQFAKVFHANSYKYSEITEDLSADSPKFFPSKFFPRTIYIYIYNGQLRTAVFGYLWYL